jgi:hypothetical protein
LEEPIVRTDELIVELARSVTPVAPLTPPSVRLGRWAAAMVVVAAAGVWLLGPRADIAQALRQPVYDLRLVTTVLTSMLAAAAALVLSVPGAERSLFQRILPLLAAGAWAAILGALLVAGGNAVVRVLAFPVNWPCSYKIFAFSLIPGIALVALIRRAAPLEPVWNAWLAGLAATTFGATATQLICPVDDPAHQLVGHVLPVLVFAVIATAIGVRSLGRWSRS